MKVFTNITTEIKKQKLTEKGKDLLKTMPGIQIVEIEFDGEHSALKSITFKDVESGKLMRVGKDSTYSDRIAIAFEKPPEIVKKHNVKGSILGGVEINKSFDKKEDAESHKEDLEKHIQDSDNLKIKEIETTDFPF